VAGDREDASSMVTAGATAHTTEGNSRASRESGLLCSHSHGESIVFVWGFGVPFEVTLVANAPHARPARVRVRFNPRFISIYLCLHLSIYLYIYVFIYIYTYIHIDINTCIYRYR